MAKHQERYGHKRWFVPAFVAAGLWIAVFAVPSLAVPGIATTAPVAISQQVKDVDSATRHAATSDSDDRTSTTSSEPTITRSRAADATGTTSTSDVVTTTDQPGITITNPRVTTTTDLTTLLTTTAAPTSVFSGAIAHLGQATGSFEVVCLYSHSKQVDPIVNPGVPSAHRHDFFGSTSTDENTTQATLDSSPTTCKRPQDKSAYWVPSVIRSDGTFDVPSLVHVYYNGEDRGGVQPIPHGLRMIAGNSMATSPQSTKIVAWQCSDNLGPTKPQATVPDCGPNRNIKVLVRFPECWDGVHLDSPDHKSHVVYYDSHRNCPAGWVQIVGANAEFKYPDLHNASDVLALSSHGLYSLHGDFWNAWDTAEMAKLVSECVDAGKKCGGSSH